MKRNEAMNILNFRHACKEFDANKSIVSEDLKVILEGGRLAPSSVGIEPWHFIVVENKEFKNELASVCPGSYKQIPTCSHFLILLTRTPNEIKYDSEYINHLLKEEHKLPEESYNAVKGYIKSVNERFKNDNEIQAYANEQTYIALSSIMLTAAMLGIDSCAIGGMDKNAVTKMLVDKGLLDKSKFEVTLGCALGYRVKEATPKKRQSFDEVVTIVK